MFAALKKEFAQSFGSFNLPSEHEAMWITNDVRHSPDLGWLEQFEFQLVFTPDVQKRGFSKYNLIQESVYLGTAYTQQTFEYWQQSVDRLPIAIKSDSASVTRYFPPALRIGGEIHAVRTPQFKNLDFDRQNRVQFLRQRVRLLVPTRPVLHLPDPDPSDTPIPPALQGKKGILGKERVDMLKAWMYVGNPEYWNPLLNAHDFSPVEHHQSKRDWLKEYYWFRRLK